jgi:hypothetical protein
MKLTAAALVFVSLFVPFAYFNHSDGWNQGARLAELHAIALQGTVQIDRYHEVTGDKALIDGHYYSEKAPATVAMALPAFVVTVSLQRMMGVDPDSPEGWRVSQWIATAGSVGLVTALGGAFFFLLLLDPLGAPLALLATYAVFLGTITFPYATAMFAHAATIGLLSIALWAVLDRPSSSTFPLRASAGNQRDYIAGLCAGLAVASEYPAIIPATALGLYLARDPARAFRYGLALVPAAVLILGNNYLISGSPFRVSYGANPAFPRITAGNSFGFSLPDLTAMRYLLWGEYRGLLFWSPVLMMAVPGLVVWFRRDRGVAVMIGLVFVFMLLQVASFYSWFGGNAVGPRYLAAAIPFLGLAAAYGIKRFPIPGAVLTMLSVTMMGMVTAIAIDPPEDVATPLRLFYFVRFRDDRFADNLGTLLGLPLQASLAVPAILIALVSLFILSMRHEHSA